MVSILDFLVHNGSYSNIEKSNSASNEIFSYGVNIVTKLDQSNCKSEFTGDKVKF